VLGDSALKDFLKLVRSDWQQRFPFLSVVDQSIGTRTPKGGIFRGEVGEQTLYLLFQRSNSQKGRFTMNVTLSGEGKIVESPASVVQSPLGIGTYRISRFWGLPDFWWALEDESAQRPAFLGALPAPVEAKKQKLWVPSSYEDPKLVLAEALADINLKLSLHVFPTIFGGTEPRSL
jgi:hypothetical protein